MTGQHKGSSEHRFGGRRRIIVPAGTRKDLPALSWPCFENRHGDCKGKCLPFEPETPCACQCHQGEMRAMTQLTEEQQRRLDEVRKNRRVWHSNEGQTTRDIDFLLEIVSLLLDSDSQAVEANYSKLAHEIISEYNSADDPGLLRSKVAEGFAQVASDVASAMRDKCVEKVEDYRRRIQYEKDEGVREALFGETVMDLESLTLDQVKPGEM